MKTDHDQSAVKHLYEARRFIGLLGLHVDKMRDLETTESGKKICLEGMAEICAAGELVTAAIKILQIDYDKPAAQRDPIRHITEAIVTLHAIGRV
jgi:hypothetical protein